MHLAIHQNGGVGVGGIGAEYAAGGNEHPRQLPKRVTNHPPCPNPPVGGLDGPVVTICDCRFNKSNKWT